MKHVPHFLLAAMALAGIAQAGELSTVKSNTFKVYTCTLGFIENGQVEWEYEENVIRAKSLEDAAGAVLANRMTDDPEENAAMHVKCQD